MLMFGIQLVLFTQLFHGKCPGGDLFEEIADTCYYFSIDRGERHTWDEARRFCPDIGSLLDETVDLAEIGNEATCQSDGLMLQKIAEKGEWSWLGGSDEEQEASWKWVTSGRSLSLKDSAWREIDPNNGADQNCLVAVIAGDYHRTYLGDLPCNNDGFKHPFVCQLF
ncbi:unnamed protein product, partial [Meganyctiphanes norvegica]